MNDDKTNDPQDDEIEEVDSAVPSGSPEEEQPQEPTGGGAASTSNTDPLSPVDQELVNTAEHLKKDIDRTYVRLARVLDEIFRKKIYRKLRFNTEEEFASKVLGMHEKRVQRLRRVYDVFIRQLGLDEETVAGIKFTNAALLTAVIKPANANDWLTKARELSSRELEREIGAVRGRGTARDDRRTVTFRVHPDQWPIIEKALELAEHVAQNVGGHSPAERLANICLQYCATQSLKKGKPEASLQFYLRIFERLFGGRFFWVKGREAADALLKAAQEHPDGVKHGGTEFRPPVQDQDISAPADTQDSDEDIVEPPNCDLELTGPPNQPPPAMLPPAEDLGRLVDDEDQPDLKAAG